jgi:hypothetical protein
MWRGARWRLAAPLVGVAIAAFLAMASPAAADVVPIVDCVAPGPGTVNVYFGYTNDGIPQSIPFGEQNMIVPGIEFQGQPTVFDDGTYLRVFRATWNQEAFGSLVWLLNGHSAVATRSGPSPSPTCVAGETGPASDLTPTTATLSAVVGVAGQQTSYNFEYGTGAAPALSTPPAIVATGQHSFVEEELTGLTPGTVYHYRVVATDEDGTTPGDLSTFTTPVVAPPVPQTPTTPGVGSTVPGVGPFTVSVRPASARSIATLRQGCAQRAAGGVVITSDRAGTASLSATVGTLNVASRRVPLASGRNVVALCLNKVGRRRIGGAGSRVRPLRALVVVAARAGTETARDSVRVSFTPGSG